MQIRCQKVLALIAQKKSTQLKRFIENKYMERNHNKIQITKCLKPLKKIL